MSVEAILALGALALIVMLVCHLVWHSFTLKRIERRINLTAARRRRRSGKRNT